MKLILASNSAARRQMLTNAGYRFEAIAADLDERELQSVHLSSDLPAEDLALLLANAKAQAIGAKFPDDMVIGSDQVLICDGKVFTKARDIKGASDQLLALQGKTHHLVSAVACWRGGQPVFEVSEAADMKMFRLTAQEIETYLDDAGPAVLGSVGCYRIEAKGIRLFENVDGSHFTIMGMPLVPLIGFLRQNSSLQ